MAIAEEKAFNQNQVTALEALRKAVWDRFDKRTEFEWRIAFALWAGMGAFGGLTLAKDSPLHGNGVVIGAAVITSSLLLLHAFLQYQIQKRNRVDSQMSFEYEDDIRTLIGFKFLEDTENARKDLVKRSRPLLFTYTPLFQLAVTFLLGIAAVIGLYWKTTQK